MTCICQDATLKAQMDKLAAQVCHDEQLTIWSGSIACVLGDHLRDGLDYEDVLEFHRLVQSAITVIVQHAFTHPTLCTAHEGEVAG